MLNVVCVQAGNYAGRGAEYVNHLFDMVRRNLPDGYEGRFVCFTDDASGLLRGIEARPLPVDGLAGWWNKLALFKPGLFDDGDRVLYFDLDTLITGRLDEIVKYDGWFGILRDAFRPGGFQSSVMMWSAGLTPIFWTAWEDAGRPILPGGDQEWIEHCTRAPTILQDRYPSLFVSYKESGGAIPDKASVVFFHGTPRPHEVATGWVPEVWKIGGITRAELDAVCNTAVETLLNNVRASRKRDLPWFDLAGPHDGHSVLVGGGPSVSDTLPEIVWRQGNGQKIWALNGSAGWLRERGVKVDVHVIVDARPENVAFVANPQKDCHYLIASQCDPILFDALQGYQVTLWHSHAPGVEDALKDEVERPVHLIGGGSTVGLSGLVLAHSSGSRKIHLHGFDSSMREEKGHAYPQPQNDNDLIVDAIATERKFRATPWMVQQAEEFVRLARLMVEDGTIITIAGDGLLPHLARVAMANPVLSPAQQRAGAVLKRLSGIASPKGAEIGVFTGRMSAALLEGRDDLHLTMVDSWEGDGAAYVGDSGDWHQKLTHDAQAKYQAEAIRGTDFAIGRRTVFAARSTDAVVWFDDASLDFVFLDADHSEEGCRADIAAWAPKVRPGGWLGGHDYENPDFPQFGVTAAVDAFIAQSGRKLELDDNLTWFVRI